MDKKTIYAGIVTLSFVAFAASAGWVLYADLNSVDMNVPLTLLIITFVGTMVGVILLTDIDKRTPVSERELDKLHSFGREPDTDNYSDWFEFSIVPIPKSKRHGSTVRWSFQLFNEVDGATTFVRYVDNMQQLKDVYKGITDKKLE